MSVCQDAAFWVTDTTKKFNQSALKLVLSKHQRQQQNADGKHFYNHFKLNLWSLQYRTKRMLNICDDNATKTKRIPHHKNQYFTCIIIYTYTYNNLHMYTTVVKMDCIREWWLTYHLLLPWCLKIQISDKKVAHLHNVKPKEITMWNLLYHKYYILWVQTVYGGYTLGSSELHWTPVIFFFFSLSLYLAWVSGAQNRSWQYSYI